MSLSINSPVPLKQRPTQEFIELKSSVFFSIATKDHSSFYRYLVYIWLLSYPIFLIICSGSYALQNDLTKLSIISLITSSIVPFLFLLRQSLGWGYINKRLLSRTIAYEESDWHDGQIWVKPETWKCRENLISKEEVSPVIIRIRSSLYALLSIIILILGIYLYLIY
ncbi:MULTISPECIES: CGLD27 family protein [unclassified Prochlorococcus]|uniref:CGLD27 family protein n=1 Tax=unclassified Prochlorococcus TaxID=2627481 RepID=UPI000533BC6D|nr:MULTISPECIES: CGLD27 family protein [unclassified Prochlorococcus]KGG15214.1 putative membrane protein Ycf36 [Prochlorococcus sp. MIT 0602]KGG17489.1 putative membrane protein Ycf36 [Prochlorococcus sp. MIT 0603]